MNTKNCWAFINPLGRSSRLTASTTLVRREEGEEVGTGGQVNEARSALSQGARVHRSGQSPIRLTSQVITSEHGNFLEADLNRDRGDASRLRPSHTTGRAGPHPAVRWVELSVHSQAWNPKRIEVSIRQRDAERGRVRQPPWAEGATRRLSGQVCTHTPLA